MGLQGSGKGTQLRLLKERLAKDSERSIVHFDAGASLREFFAAGGYTQEKVKASMSRGEIQPVFLPAFLWASCFITRITGDEHILVDGSPRSLLEGELLDGALKFYGRKTPTVIFLNVSEPVAMERLLKRGRHDDTEEGIRERFRWYREIAMRTVDFYRGRPEYRVLDINGEQTPEEVDADIKKKLGISQV